MEGVVRTCHQWLRPETGAAKCRLQTGSQYELSFHLLRSTAYVQYVRRCECDVPITRRLALGRRYSGRIRIFLGRLRSRLIECLGAACGGPPEHATGCRGVAVAALAASLPRAVPPLSLAWLWRPLERSGCVAFRLDIPTARSLPVHEPPLRRGSLADALVDRATIVMLFTKEASPSSSRIDSPPP